jgi:hypothetical protein
MRYNKPCFQQQSGHSQQHLNRAYFLVLPNVHMLDLGGPLQVIATLAELGIAPVSVQCITR